MTRLTASMCACLVALGIGCDGTSPAFRRLQGTPVPLSTGSVLPTVDPASGSASASIDPSPSASGGAGGTPTPVPTGSAGATPEPTVSPSAQRTLPPEQTFDEPTPTPAPTPTPEPTPFPTSVKVSPTSGTINAEAPFGQNAAGFVSTIKLKAEVVLSTGATTDLVTWTSSDPGRVPVAADGTVTALASASAGAVTITATAKGATPSATASLEITTIGRLKVKVE